LCYFVALPLEIHGFETRRLEGWLWCVNQPISSSIAASLAYTKEHKLQEKKIIDCKLIVDHLYGYFCAASSLSERW